MQFTKTGDLALDQTITEQLQKIGSDVLAVVPTDEFVALVLGGGYGRGEGGALHAAGRYHPYNDYDLVLIHSSSDLSLWQATLKELQEEHSRRCGIHVDIKLLALDSLPHLPHTLTWCELQQGHQVVVGCSDVLSKMGQRDLALVLPSEWGRLLFNRASGLLFAGWVHQGIPCAALDGEDPDSFTLRQVQKAWLALGDTWLADRGLYDSSVVRRSEIWRTHREAVPDYSAEYLRAAEFKLSPELSLTRIELIDELNKLGPLMVEELTKRPVSTRRPLVSIYSTLKSVRPRLWLASAFWRYPRERLKLALIDELQGRTLLRRRLVGSPQDYVSLWDSYG